MSTLTANPIPRVEPYGVHEPLARRRSTRAFDPTPLSDDVVDSLFEAARWAPSAMNRQGWRFVIGRRTALGPNRSHRALEASLQPGNQAWAATAPLLVAAVAPTHLESVPDVTVAYELGLAVANLETQANALGLVSHQMGGFDATAVKDAFAIPPGWTPLVVVAVGWPGDAARLPARLAERERAPRTRLPVASLVFADSWEQPGMIEDEAVVA